MKIARSGDSRLIEVIRGEVVPLNPNRPTAYQWGVSDYWRGNDACRFPIDSHEEGEWLLGYTDAKKSAEG